MDEFDDPEFDRLGASALDSVSRSFPAQPIPQKQLRPGFNAILVNARQKGNPVLNSVRNVPWEYGDIQADFVVGATACAMFLSLKYHRLHPEYIYNRVRDLGKSYGLRVMLVLCDIENHSDSLRELAKTCVVNNFALVVAWTAAEAGRYLESFKSLETAPAKEIRGQISTVYSDQLADVLTSVRSINKTDAWNLVGTFGTLRAALEASPEELSALPGWGPQKVKNFTSAINLPFTIENGTTRAQQEQVLLNATKAGRSEFNGDFGPGTDHSAGREANPASGFVTDDGGRESGNAEPGRVEGDADFAGPQTTSEIPDGTVEIADGTGAAGLEAGLQAVEAEGQEAAENGDGGQRTRPVNPEYQGTLDILKRMREQSGYAG
ncbi:Mating-type switching protein swi10 [Taphrina deformans PYCC 5710]|uniref:Mating-type switching protein swi10 n=1 Tax=Taphrina deformans (strain PYCC 5710 / ATCC 11124 / CBS 356.35 / IMI 108563 / JCM 9778 / NBRC 8474) TaxID=1097556 RepID=R4XCW8_TAPDE|nr:Mating-type switching protein swi10 [Taphrina deformans PYCC 5710]|eukprot:CCG83649.1 Mating-type switching protein swi10 [Taphrina deformans PYCC 5710]